MKALIINTSSYFDGENYHNSGPYQLCLKDGVIDSITDFKNLTTTNIHNQRCLDSEFIMPGLVEAHCHLFLDGAELEFKNRSAYLKSSQDNMLNKGIKNVDANLRRGITLIRDAGDRFGVNHILRSKYTAANSVEIRSPGLAIRHNNRYGAFMAKEVSSDDEIQNAINEIAETADDLKILLTGIIDFEAGTVTQSPQFDLDTLNLIISIAKEKGLKTFVHCSGIEGLEIAVKAGVDSIEHGFFMNEAILDVMVEKNIAWVPTISPVYFQWANPQLMSWNENTIANLRSILDQHFYHINLAYQKGVQLVAGSDAGSYGVQHGIALIDELYFFLESGLPMLEVLKTATSRPRHLWSCESANITENNTANLLMLGSDPFKDANALRNIQSIYLKNSLIEIAQKIKVSC